MRRFSLFAAYMPSKLVEAQAEIFNHEGKHCTGDHIQLSRFGYAVHWCDGSGMAGFSEDETLETAIADANKYLKENGWKMGPLTYTAQEITPEIIEKCTKAINPEESTLATYADFLRLKIECMQQPWFELVRNTLDGAVGIHNIKMLPEKAKEHVNELIGFDRDGNIIVKVGYEFDSGGNIKSYKADWKNIDDAKKILGLPETASNLDVVNALVDDIVNKSAHLGDIIRKEKEEFLAKFTKIIPILDNVIRTCASRTSCAPDLADLAALSVYAPMILESDDWRQKTRFKTFIHRDIFDIIGNEFMFFDWTTCQIDIKIGNNDSNLVHGKVKVRDDIYEKVRALFQKEFPEKTEKSDKLHDEYAKSVFYGDWRITTRDAQWLYFRYGISRIGIPVATCAYGPETIPASPDAGKVDDYFPPDGLEHPMRLLNEISNSALNDHYDWMSARASEKSEQDVSVDESGDESSES
jgi:hypothetical protein